MKSVRLVIEGQVQGVGYRDWMVHEAGQAGVVGWVRNRGHSTVEAVVQGSEEAVDTMIRLCRQGPRYAKVREVQVETVPATEMTTFERKASAFKE